jgi:hypothetical protein
MTFGMHYAALVPLSLIVTKEIITLEEAIERAAQFEKMIEEGPRPKAALPLKMLIATLRLEQDQRAPDQAPRAAWQPRVVEGGLEREDSDD